MNILILGGRAPVAVHLARILSMHSVYIADRVSLAKNSMAIKESLKIVSKPNKNIEGYLKEINGIINKNKIDIVIPTCEETIYISMIRDKLQCKVLVDDFQKILTLHNKYEFIKLCDMLGLKTPKTEIYRKDAFIKITNKSIIKPIFSRFGTFVKVINNTNEIVINEDNKYIIQELIKGQQYCTFSLVKEGNILLHVNYKTKHAIGMGTSIYYEYCESNRLKDIVSKIVKELNLSGQVAFDFIKFDNDFYPIECNPRSTSGLTLIPYDTDIIGAFINGEKIKVDKFNITSMKTNMFLHGIFKGKFLNKEYRNDYKNSRDIVYDGKDKMPFLNQFWVVLYFLILSLIYRKSITGITTFDIEYNGD